MGNKHSNLGEAIASELVADLTFNQVNLYQKSSSPPSPNSCNYIMNDTERKCYLDRYPDLQTAYGSNNLESSQEHWREHGCKENRDNQCPGPQSTSGAFTFQGCFKDETSRAIPQYTQNVQNVDECRAIADQNNKNIFGMQDFGQCFIGDSLDEAKKYGYLINKDQCGNNGKEWTNQVYAKNSPIPQPPPPIPRLSSPNFSQENFENSGDGMESGDFLNKGFNNLYNQIFCDLWPTNDGFHTCNECKLTGAQTIWKTTTENSSESCKQSCKRETQDVHHIISIKIWLVIIVINI